MTTLTGVVMLAALGGAAAGPDDRPPDARPVKLEIRRAEDKPAAGLKEAALPGTDDKIYLHPKAELTGKDVAAARVVRQADRPAVEVVFTREGQKQMARLSEDHLNRRLAILLDGKVLSAPVVRGKLSEKAVLTGRFTEAEAAKLARSLQGE